MKTMASWPAQGDYRDALQNLDLAFRDPVLRSCTVERNRMGVPRARAGAFASVYKLTRPNGQAIALKLFNFPSEDRQRRYQKVSEHLVRLGARRPNCLVEFAYQLDGIRVGANHLPIQTMAWVTGQTLGQWVRDKMAARDHAAVRKMADHWAELVTTLRAADIAHGDLQHDNVMVQGDRPVLVDYDGMCVPGLEGADQLEHGKPAYQHPHRGQLHLSLDLDHFSAWVILIALRAVAAEPDLYKQFVERPENENLLFAEADIREPARSLLWPRLLKSRDPEVGGWATELRGAIDRPVEQIPRFGMNPAAKLTELCTVPAPDWEAIADEANRLQAAKKPIPTAPVLVLQRIAEARKRIAARDAVRQAILGKNATALAACYEPALFAGWSSQAGLAKQAARMLEKSALLRRLADAAKVADGGRTLVTTWDEVEAQVKGDAEAAPYETQARTWRDKIAALEKLRLALKAATTERLIADAWSVVLKVGPHPDLTTAEATRGKQALARADRIDKLKAVPKAESEAADRVLIAAWDDELLGECAEAQPYKARVAPARLRLVDVAAVAAVVQAADRGTATEADVIAAGAKLPSLYQYNHASRVQLAREGQVQYAELFAVLDADPQSEVAIAAAWKRLQTRHPKLAARVDATKAARCNLAARRAAAIDDITKAVSGPGNEYDRDMRIFKAFKPNQDDLKGCPEIVPFRTRIELAYTRLKSWKELSDALAARDEVLVPKLAMRDELKNYPPVLAEQERIQELSALAGRISSVHAKLKAAAAGDHFPLNLDEFLFLRANPHLYSPDNREKILRLLTKRIGDQVQMTRGIVPFQLLPGPIPQARVFWTWSGFGLVSRFLFATNAARPLSDPYAIPPMQCSECLPEDHTRDGGGRTILLCPGKDVWVTIWPVVELWGQELYGEPLAIGPIRVGGRR